MVKRPIVPAEGLFSNNMVDVEATPISVAMCFIGHPAGLAGVVVSVECLLPLDAPIRAVETVIPALPDRVIFSRLVFRLPFAGALLIAKVALWFLDVDTVTLKGFPTPSTFCFDQTTTPPV